MEAFAVTIARETLYLVLILSAAPVGGAMIVGLAVSLFQATTQIQEQTLTFVPKLVVVIVILAVLGPLGAAKLISFTKTLLITFPDFIK